MIYVSSIFLRNEAVFHKRLIPRSKLDGVAKGRRPDTRASLFFNRGRLLPCSVCLSCLHRCFVGFLLQFAASPINKYFSAEALNKIPDLTVLSCRSHIESWVMLPLEVMKARQITEVNVSSKLSRKLKRGLSPQPHGLGGLLLKNNSTEGGGEVEGEAREGGEGVRIHIRILGRGMPPSCTNYVEP